MIPDEQSVETVLLLSHDLYTSVPFVRHKSEYVIYVRRVQSRLKFQPSSRARCVTKEIAAVVDFGYSL